MRVDEFRRIKLRIIQEGNIIYEGEAENLPEEMKEYQSKEIKIQPGLAEIII